MSSSPKTDPLVTISSLEHYTYCPRQCALIDVEGVWTDDANTVAGTILHDRVDVPGWEMDDTKKVLRALPLFSKTYGLVGKADVVEILNEIPTPVEYKKGRKKKWAHDEIQLCAQALCLEEMFNTRIERGFIYHATSKRRREVSLDEDLRQQTSITIEAVRKLIITRDIPRAELKPQCKGCSLRVLCMPEIAQANSTMKKHDYEKIIWEG